MKPKQLAPALAEDEHADLLVRRGHNVGGGWIIASVAAFGVCFVASSIGTGAIAFGIGTVLFTIGMLVRARYWRRARREIGDAAMQRARWRWADAERDSPDRLIAAFALVGLLLAYQLWKG